MKIYLAAVLACAALVTSAQKPITGAFGYTLGGTLAPERVIAQPESNVFAVKTDKPFRKMTGYSVLVNPKSKKISMVISLYITQAGDGKSELALIKNLLEGKYGKFHPAENGYFYEHGGRKITLIYVQNAPKEYVYIIYADMELSKQFESESKQTQDTSML